MGGNGVGCTRSQMENTNHTLLMCTGQFGEGRRVDDDVRGCTMVKGSPKDRPCMICSCLYRFTTASTLEGEQTRHFSFRNI